MSRSRAWQGAALAVTAGLLLVALQFLARWVPPLQSPDELAHLIRVASLAQGQALATTEPGVSTGSHFDIALAALARVHVPVIQQRNPDVSPDDVRALQTQRWTGRLIYGEAPGSAMYLPLIYTPAALGLAMGQALDWTVLDSYHLARMTSQVFCVAVMALAAWIWAPPLLAWALLMLPMSLFQMLSPVVDGPAHALTLLALSMLMRLRHDPRAIWAWGTAVCLLVLVTARLHLMPLLLLPLWWAWRKPWAAEAAAGDHGLTNWRPANTLAWAGASGIVCALLWTAWAASAVVDTRVQRDVSPGAVVAHYLRHPLELLAVFQRTFEDQHRPQFLLDSFIGNLGWLDTRLAEAAYPSLWWGLAARAVLSVPWGAGAWRGTMGDRLVLTLCAGGSSALAFLLMLVTWSPFPAQLVEGVQGRYFIAPALVAAYALGAWPGPTACHGRPSGTGVWQMPQWPARAVCLGVAFLALGVFLGLSMGYLLDTLQARYPAWARGGLFG